MRLICFDSFCSTSGALLLVSRTQLQLIRQLHAGSLICNLSQITCDLTYIFVWASKMGCGNLFHLSEICEIFGYLNIYQQSNLRRNLQAHFNEAAQACTYSQEVLAFLAELGRSFLIYRFV